MSGCSKYQRVNKGEAKSIKDLDLTTQFLVNEILLDFPYVWVFGSRWKGNYSFCSDFDFAIPIRNPKIINKIEIEFRNKYGLNIEFRAAEFYDQVQNMGIKIKR